MSEELKPCPFCGSPAEMYPDGDEEGHQVMCSSGVSSCHMNTFGHQTVDEAVVAWNTRALTQRPAAQADPGYLNRLIDALLMPPAACSEGDLRKLQRQAAEMLELMRSTSQPAAQATPEPTSKHRPSPEWYAAMVKETMDDDFVIGPSFGAAPEPVGEPYAWVYTNSQNARVLHLEPSARLDADKQAAATWPNHHKCIPLYTHPAPGVPEDVQRNADRYRLLREQDWFSGPLCVLREPKRVLTRGIGLGADCPSGDRLDAAIDAMLAAAHAKGGDCV